MMLPNGGNPDSAAPASSAANGIPGMIVAVDDPLQFAGSQASAQIPGFQLGGFQPGGGNKALGYEPKHSIAGLCSTRIACTTTSKGGSRAIPRI